MKRSFKKAIAVLLAVLMAAFSVPFSAFAAPGDYAPDFDLMFGTFHPADATTWTDSERTAVGADYSMCGLFDVPVDMDFTLTEGGKTKSGTLYIDKDKANTTLSSLDSIGAGLGYDPLTENRVLGVGDYFTLTTILKNCPSIAAAMFCLQYSDNIEPAGYYSYKAGRQTKYAVGTLSEYTANGGTEWLFGGAVPIKDMSSEGIYGMNVGATGNATRFLSDDQGRNFLFDEESCQNGSDGIRVDTAYNDYFVNPETGDAANGYTYNNVTILETVVFKITGTGPIDFSVYDTDDSIRGGFEGASLCADGADTTMLWCNTTYAYNDLDRKNKPTGVERPNSRMFTAFGTNVNGKNGDPYPPETPTECTHANLTAVDAKAATCTDAGNEAYWTCPDCSKMFSDASAQTEITAIPTIAATGHKLTSHPEVSPTCVVAGTGAYWTCDNCSKMFSDANGDTEITEIPVLPALEHSYEVIEDTTSTCTQAGYTTYECTKCHDIYTTDKELAGHNLALVTEVASTCTQAGVGAHYECSVCQAIFADAEGKTPTTLEKLALPLANHTFGAWTSNNNGTHTRTCTECKTETETQDCNYSYEVITPATITIAGLGRYTCTDCGYTYDEEIPVQTCTHPNLTAVDAKAATCTDAGNEAYWTCSDCSKMFSDAEAKNEITEIPTIAATGHKLTPHAEVSATCTSTGTEAYWTCDNCSKMFSDADGNTEIQAPVVIEMAEHNPVLDETTAVAPTIDKEGKEADTVCSVCHKVIKEGAVIPMLASVEITVAATDLGTTTLNGVDSTAGLTTKVEKDSTVTLSAAPVEGAEFVGWALNGKIVSSSADFNVKAFTSASYTPVFTETAANTFTVVFVDNYGNVIDTQTVASAADITAPTAPARPGYTFTGWSVDYTTLTQGATIYAQYTKDAAATYTVTAAGCTITTADGASATDSLADLPFDTMVTVTANSATATSWKIGDATVAFGESYTFYVGSDVTVVPQFDSAVTAVPTVSNVSMSTTVSDTGYIRPVFLATRSMTDDCRYVAAGFIYGKDLADTNITIDDVNGTTVRRVQAASNAEQFALTAGIKSQTGSMTARAYLVYVDADGATQTIYAEPQTYTYA